MRVRLLHPDRDLDPKAPLPARAEALERDLDLGVLLDAMGAGDRFVREVAERGIFDASDDPAVVRRRLAALRDVRENHALVLQLYREIESTLERERSYWGIGNYPESVLYRGLKLLELHCEALLRIRAAAEAGSSSFRSDAFLELFRRLRDEMPDAYLGQIRDEIEQLRFPNGMWISASFGPDGRPAAHVLRRPIAPRAGWWRRRFGPRRSPMVFEIDEHDESGARALSDFRERGVAPAATAVAQSNDHLSAFLTTLRAELGFLLGCLNLERALSERGGELATPEPCPAPDRVWSAVALYDPCLALRTSASLVPNDLAADGRSMVVVTGANQGGKSTFLRAVGVAQVLMQAGMRVPARAYRASVASIVLSHFAREEDPTLAAGRFDDELTRMQAVAGLMRPYGLLLSNESFASTDEREGSEIAEGVLRAFRESHVRVIAVTHLYELAHRLATDATDDLLFLRAERTGEGRRTFRILPGAPLPSSFAADVFREVFGAPPRGAAL